MLGGGGSGGGPGASGAAAAAPFIVPPDATTFTGLFTLAEAACDGATAAALYARMRTCGVKDDAVACGALFGALGAGAAAAFRRGGKDGGGSAPPLPPAEAPPAAAAAAGPPSSSSSPDAATVAALAAAADPAPARLGALAEAVWGRMVWGPRRLKPRPAQALAAVRCLLDCGRPAAAARVAAGAGVRLAPRDLDRLTQAVADAAGAGEGEGREAAAALARLLRRSASAATPAPAPAPSSSSSSSSSPSSSPTASSLPFLRLDVGDLAPAPARAAVLCALADLADGGGAVPPGGLKIAGVGGVGGGGGGGGGGSGGTGPPARKASKAPPPASPTTLRGGGRKAVAGPAAAPPLALQPAPDPAAVRTSLVRLLRDDLGIAVEEEAGDEREGDSPALVVSGGALERWVAGRRAKSGEW